MKKIILSILLITVLLFSFFSITSLSATVNEDINYEFDKNFRKNNGLDYSDDAILNARKSPSKTSKSSYGVVLTAEEERKIKDRDKKIKELSPKIEEILYNNEDNPSELGTFHLELEEGLKFVVSLDKKNNQKGYITQKLEKVIPNDLLVIKEVNFSEKELRETYINIISNEELSKFINRVTVSFFENVIEIGVDEINDEIIFTLNELYGSDIIEIIHEPDNKNEYLVSTTSTSYTDRHAWYNTLGGGLKISNPIGGCTSSFTATKNDVRYLVTAGHCISNEYSNNYSQGSELYSPSNIIGAEHYKYNGDFADVGLIRLNSIRTIANGLFKYSAYNEKSTTVYDSNFTSYQDSVWKVRIGAPACMSGFRGHGFQCGRIESTLHSFDGKDYYIKLGQLVEVKKGDSGSPVWYNGELYGIVSFGVDGGDNLGYGHINEAIKRGGNFVPYSNSIAK